MKPKNLKALIVDKYFGRDNKENRLKAIKEFDNEVWFDMFDDFCEFIKNGFASEDERGNHTIEDDEKIDNVIRDCFLLEFKEAEEGL
jgi:hypothetical protein